MAIRGNMQLVRDPINLTAFHALVCASALCRSYAWLHYLALLRN